MKSAKSAKILSIYAGIICFSVALLPLVAGLFIKNLGLDVDNPSLVLPLAMKKLCPPIIGALGISAISCAVMSSIDSTILSSSQLFSEHILAKESKLKVPQYLICSAVGLLSVLLALKFKSVYALWYLCSEFVYIFIFPHFVTTLVCKNFNPNVFWLSNITALAIRLVLPIEVFFWKGILTQTNLPIKSLAMLSSLSILLAYNFYTETMYLSRRNYDKEKI